MHTQSSKASQLNACALSRLKHLSAGIALVFQTAVCLPSDMNRVLSSGIGGTETELRVKVKDFHLTELGKKQSHPGPPQDSTQAVLPGYWFPSASPGMMFDEFIDAHLSPVHEPLWGQRLLSTTLWTVSLVNMSLVRSFFAFRSQEAISIEDVPHVFMSHSE
ncbi:hypothetical protein RB195_022825 [Necator americanus]|uniref:Uncharacterized protein n=1 Tax=Necator americanus TaxID=51031 RepID=A0ABR1EJB2_NECAM